jgi:DNA-binding beta-propeller fold protein YncE
MRFLVAPVALGALLLAAFGASREGGYLSPSELVADARGRLLYVAAETASEILAVEAASGAVVWRIELPDPPGGLCLTPDGTRLYVTGAAPRGKVFEIDAAAGRIVRALPAGHTPVAPRLSPDGRELYILNRFDNAVAVFDLQEGVQIGLIPVVREPVAAALTPDGRRLIVANLLPSGPANGDYVASRVSVIDTVNKRVARHIPLPNGSTGVRGVAVSPDGRQAYVVHIQAHFQLVTIQLDRGWMNTNALSIIDPETQTLIYTMVLDEQTLGAANPWDVAITGDGRHLVVTHSGTHELSVIDREALQARIAGRPNPYRESARRSAFLTSLPPPDFRLLEGIRRRVRLAGLGPRGLALAGSKAYAAEYFSDSVAVVELPAHGSPEVGSFELAPPREWTLERRGEFLFHDASKSYQQWQSCASCHPGQARADGLNWDLMNDGTGNAKSTKSLLMAHETPPAMLSGVRERAEVAVRAGFRVILFSPRREEDAAAVDAWLKSLRPVPSPFLVDGKLSAAAKRGKLVFEKAGCASCHPPPLYTDQKDYDVGTSAGVDAGRKYDTPTLVEVWRTAPYLADGRAATIRDVLTIHNPGDRHGVTSKLTEQEIRDLEEFVLSL